MIIRAFSNPWLTELIQVCSLMPEDERKQLEAFTGEEYSIDSAAVGNYSSPGPKWVIKAAECFDDFAVGKSTPLVVGGFVPQRPGVYRDWLITTPQAFEKPYAFTLTRICRRIMDAMLTQAHRLECVVPAARLQSRPELREWYRVLGYNEEGLRYGYCANGADAVGFSRVKH